MPDYRRYYPSGFPVFITCVTQNRKPILNSEENIELFWKSIDMVKSNHPFSLLAFSVLPDHFHLLLIMPNNDSNFSKVLLSLKWNYTLNYKKHHNISESLKLWQRGFWDHVIRDDRDFQVHLDYIHWNPVKHGYVANPEYWAQSSFVDWKLKGTYGDDWGTGKEPDSINGLSIE